MLFRNDSDGSVPQMFPSQRMRAGGWLRRSCKREACRPPAFELVAGWLPRYAICGTWREYWQVVDGFKGLPEAVTTTWESTVVQQ